MTKTSAFPARPRMKITKYIYGKKTLVNMKILSSVFIGISDGEVIIEVSTICSCHVAFALKAAWKETY